MNPELGFAAHLPNSSEVDSIRQMNRHRTLIAVLGLVLLTAITYRPALRGGFIWDDDDHLTQNRAVAAPNGLKMIWTSLAVSRYYPLTLTSFWVERRLWGLNPWPYHAVNIALHAVNAALLFALLRKLNVRGAWVAAALWAVHPVNVESVAWVTELKNVQSGLFFFLSLLCYLRFEDCLRHSSEAERPGAAPVWYSLSLLCAAGAVLSKPSTVVLPLVLLLLAWWQRGRVLREDALRATPFFALASAMSAWTIVEQQVEVATPGQNWSLTLMERLIVAGRAVWFYAGKMVWPANLIFIYPRWQLDANAFLSVLWLAGVALVAFVIGRYRFHAWARASALGLGYFLIALLPVLGFFDIYFFRYSFVADHFQYLAGIGIVALVSAAGAASLRRRAVQVPLAAVTVAALSVMSWRHTHVFRDQEVLWRDTLAKNPQAAIAYNNLGAVLNEQKRYQEAIGYLQEALRLRPGTAEPHNNLGIALTELGRYDEALGHLQEAVQVRPDFTSAHYRLGVLYSKMNRLDEAEDEYLAALRYGPPTREACFELGLVWEHQGKRRQACTAYRDALRIDPDYAYAHNNLANLLAEDGKLDEAIRHYRQAVAADPRLEAAHRNLAVLLRRAGDIQGAIQHLRSAAELEPTRANTWLDLGETLMSAGRYGEAIEAFRHGLEVQPENVGLGNALAWLLATCPEAQWRDGAQAVRISERVVGKTDRKRPDILDTLAAAYAEVGRFDDAVRVAKEAVTLAQAGTDSNMTTAIDEHLRLYELHQAFRLRNP